MNSVGAFVHLYHVWGVLGLVTAVVYGRNIWAQWRVSGGTAINAPGELARLIWHHARLSVSDIGAIVRGAWCRFTGLDHVWSQDPKSPWTYGTEHSLLLGIMLGGVARFATAFYWAELNTAWVSTEMVWVPSIPILLAVLADLSHHATALKSKMPLRWAIILSTLWIVYGAFNYPVIA